MKLATYKDGSRDGQLVVVSRDLSTAHYATGMAHKLQQVLDDWNFISPQLNDLYLTLNQGKARHAFPFDPSMCMAPLPRAYQWATGAAYSRHGAPADTNPWVCLGGSDGFLGPCDDVAVPSEDGGIDFGAALAVVTGDVPMGATPEQALDGIRLLMLVNDVSLQQLMPPELAQGCSGWLCRPATACSPVAVTPDELGDAWRGGRVHLTLQSTWNGRKVGMCEAGPEMNFHFGQLIAHIAKTRPVRAGSVVGSGRRAIETILEGRPSTAYMRFGDTIRIEMRGKDGQSIFGAIDQTLAPLDV